MKSPPSRHALAVVALTTALWLPCSVPALANAPADSAASAIAGQPLRGRSLYRYWGFEVYVASLYAAPTFVAERFEQERFALELQYRRAFRGEDIAQRSIEEMQDISPLPPEQTGVWLATMKRLFPDVSPGDRLLGVYRPGGGASFYLNGQPRGSIDDPVFAARFFGIWLSPRTSAPQLREALIAATPR
ncbi:MAG: chalcone isomerase family protein [Hydrogenophaga sp.]|nr:chalcone isomerase family protein [Hydrogenophaga sp.]